VTFIHEIGCFYSVCRVRYSEI